MEFAGALDIPCNINTFKVIEKAPKPLYGHVVMAPSSVTLSTLFATFLLEYIFSVCYRLYMQC